MERKYLNWLDCVGLTESMVGNINAYKQENKLVCLKIYGVPRGGVPVAILLNHTLESRRIPSFLVEDALDANIIVDDIVDSGRTRTKYQSINPSALFLALVESPKDKWIVFPWEKGTEDLGPEENVVRLMQFIGEDVKREGLIETPKRVIRSYEKLFGGYRQNPEDIMKTFTEGACDNMVVLKNIELYSTCEHHMLPFYGKCHIAYIPNGKVIGVSKLARLMEIYSRRMQIQERIGQQVTAALEKFLQPRGAACIIEAQHFCMTSRGVEKQNSVMVTSSLTGDFLTDRDTRNELMNLIRG